MGCCGVGYVLFSPPTGKNADKKKKGKKSSNVGEPQEDDQSPLLLGGVDGLQSETGSQSAAAIAHLPTTTLDNRQLAAQALPAQQSHQIQFTPGTTMLADPQVLVDPQTGQELELVTVTPNGYRSHQLQPMGRCPQE